MMDAIRELVLAVVLYGLPLAFGHRCIGVGIFLWPFGCAFLVAGVVDLLMAVSA